MTSFVSKQLLGRNFQSYKSNDRTVLLPNFKAVGQRHAELHCLKVEKLDACIRPFSQIRSQLFPCSATSVFTMISVVLFENVMISETHHNLMTVL